MHGITWKFLASWWAASENTDRGEDMIDHQFGGAWTEQKLEALKHYLTAYRLIFTQNEKARFFKTIYIDAFAGTGERKTADVSDEASLFDPEELPELDAYKKGSARIALELSSPFDEYIFIDKKKEHAAQLVSTIESDYPQLASRCKVMQGDGTKLLTDICRNRDWKKSRAVVFLDPYGMNIEWALLKQIADTKAIDLWLLFPLGMGANRLLKRDSTPPLSFSEKLTRIFGTPEWHSAFYKPSTQGDFFSEEISLIKNASFDQIGEFLIGRLKSIFSGVAPTTKALFNSRSNPMYLLCFAAGNPIGAPTAVKIGNHLLGK